MCDEYFKAAVVSQLLEVGFEMSENDAVNILTELLSCVFNELGKKTLSFAEHAGRSQPIGAADIILAAVNMGINIDNLKSFAFRTNRPILLTVTPPPEPKPLPLLQTGIRKPHPPYIPSYLPPFPEVHTYIRTPAYKRPLLDYEKAREMTAVNQRDLEESYNKFLTDTSETESLFFNQENDCFPLLAVKPVFPSYIDALIPLDQSFKHIYGEEEKSTTQKKGVDEKEEPEETETNLEHLIDNPYVRAGKMRHKRST